MNKTSSLKCFAKSCIPIGIPSLSFPHGIDIPGIPAIFTFRAVAWHVNQFHLQIAFAGNRELCIDGHGGIGESQPLTGGFNHLHLVFLVFGMKDFMSGHLVSERQRDFLNKIRSLMQYVVLEVKISIFIKTLLNQFSGDLSGHMENCLENYLHKTVFLMNLFLILMTIKM